MNTQRVLVLSYSEYSFPDQETGKLIEGATVWYVALTSDDRYTNGLKPAKASLKLENVGNLATQQLPAFGDLHFNIDFSRNQLRPFKFDNLNVFELVEVDE